MLRKSLLITAFAVSSVGMTGCSTITTMWNSTNDLVQGVSSGVSEVAKFAWLRGPSKKSDISFAKNVTPEADTETGVYKTAVGEYVPTATVFNEGKVVDIDLYDMTLNDTENLAIDTSPHPCPDGTYLAEDKSCMSLETETFDFADITSNTVNVPVDTSPHPCPDGTYMAEDNSCMFLDNEATDFARDLAAEDIKVVVDTSQHECPEGTYLNAENECMYLETEEFDFASDTPSIVPASDFTPDFALNAPMAGGPIECPPGFTLNGTNSCMYVGEGLQSGN